MDYATLIKIGQMVAPKGGISSYPKNIYREPTDEALKRAKQPPKFYWPQDTIRPRQS